MTREGLKTPTERVFRAVFAQCVPLLCRVLKVLISGGFAAEYDVGGVSDPYLQVKILHLLRLLSEGEPSVGDSISDILAQVATNVDGGKGAGKRHPVRVRAHDHERARQQRAARLGGEHLGQVLGIQRQQHEVCQPLSHADGRSRDDPQALNRHRTVILECVKDTDDSIPQEGPGPRHGRLE